MPTLPTEIMTLLAYFAPLCTVRTWGYVPALVAGSILTPKRRLVSTALRALGLAQVSWFQNFHRVLNRACWSPLAARRVLLGLLVTTLEQVRDDPATVWTPARVVGWYGQQEQDLEITSGTAVW